jgi:predicted AlkP superfamily phosphohydrolase/phosphomutase
MSQEPAANGSTSRTVVLSFDALTFRYLDEFGVDLPNFNALRERGVEAPLRSTFPPWTASAWPSMFTGTDPSHHGVFNFFDYGEGYPDSASTVTRQDVKAPALWDYCSVLDLPSIVLNMPVTHPADPIDGVLIPGFMAPEDAAGHPEGIRAELDSAVGEYRINPGTEGSRDKAAKLDGYIEQIDTHGHAAEHLLTNHDWRLAVVQVQETDSVFHNFDDQTAFRPVYRAADRLVGTIMEAVGNDVNVVVCSDHGMGPDAGYRIYLNEVLCQHGYVETTAADATSRFEQNQRQGGGTIGPISGRTWNRLRQ